jgi:anti-sigma B factor antagonist
LTTVRNAGGNLKLARASDKIEQLLVVTKLVTVFEHFDTVDEALGSFK